MQSVKTDQTAQMHRLIRLHCSHKSFCRFCHALVTMYQDPDQVRQSAAPDMGLHCLLRSV